MDLELFETYWIGQFSGLLNTLGKKVDTQDSEVAKRIKTHLRSQCASAQPAMRLVVAGSS